MKNNCLHFPVTNKKVTLKFVLEISIIVFLGHHDIGEGRGCQIKFSHT